MSSKRKRDEESDAKSKRAKNEPVTNEAHTRKSTRLARQMNLQENPSTYSDQDGVEEKPSKIYDLLNGAREAIVQPHEQTIFKSKGVRSSDTYGELKPNFMTELFRRTGVTSEHIYVDLGSGVGNTVLQAALEIGCKSYGSELNNTRHKLAEPFRVELISRCSSNFQKDRLSSAERVKVVEEDMFAGESIARSWLMDADLVLCTNSLFSTEMNEEILYMVMTMKVGAKVATMAPLLVGSFEPGEYNPMTRLHQEKIRSKKNQAGWTNGAFDWYLYTRQ